MRAWKRLEQQGIVIKSLWAFIGILALLYLMQSLSIASIPSKLRVYIPPNLSAGGVVRVDKVPPSQVYAFAALVFTQINTWPTSGTDDYERRIKRYGFYLSPEFKSQLLDDAKRRADNGELSRVRLMSGMIGYGYSLQSVKPLGNHQWVVSLDVNLEELIANTPVKSTNIHYALIVSRAKLPINVNPWGLIVKGYASDPYRIKTKV